MTLQVTGKGHVEKLNPVLLSKTEIQWLLGKTKVSKLFEYQLKSRIKKKVQSLMELELPLLVKTNFINRVWSREFSVCRYRRCNNKSVDKRRYD